MAKRTLTPAEIGDIVRTVRKEQNLRQDELAGAGMAAILLWGRVR